MLPLPVLSLTHSEVTANLVIPDIPYVRPRGMI